MMNLLPGALVIPTRETPSFKEVRDGSTIVYFEERREHLNKRFVGIVLSHVKHVLAHKKLRHQIAADSYALIMINTGEVVWIPVCASQIDVLSKGTPRP